MKNAITKLINSIADDSDVIIAFIVGLGLLTAFIVAVSSLKSCTNYKECASVCGRVGIQETVKCLEHCENTK